MMRSALARSGVEPERVGYINAHGTSTPYNDKAETQAIKTVFGAHAYELAVSSTKSVFGHLSAGGGGRGDDVRSRTARRRSPADDQLPQPGPDCDLDYVPNEARKVRSTSHSRTRWASAGTTRASCSDDPS